LKIPGLSPTPNQFDRIQINVYGLALVAFAAPALRLHAADRSVKKHKVPQPCTVIARKQERDGVQI